jgi:hypothetical protein
MLDLDQIIKERHSTRMFLHSSQCRGSWSVRPSLWRCMRRQTPTSAVVHGVRDRSAPGPPRCRPPRRGPATAAQYPTPARVVRALSPRSGCSSLRVDGNRSRRQGGQAGCGLALLGVLPHATGWHYLHAPGPRLSRRPQRGDTSANVALSLDRTRPRRLLKNPCMSRASSLRQISVEG